MTYETEHLKLERTQDLVMQREVKETMLKPKHTMNNNLTMHCKPKTRYHVISLCEVIFYTHAAFTESKCTSTAQQ